MLGDGHHILLDPSDHLTTENVDGQGCWCTSILSAHMHMGWCTVATLLAFVLRHNLIASFDLSVHNSLSSFFAVLVLLIPILFSPLALMVVVWDVSRLVRSKEFQEATGKACCGEDELGPLVEVSCESGAQDDCVTGLSENKKSPYVVPDGCESKDVV